MVFSHQGFPGAFVRGFHAQATVGKALWIDALSGGLLRLEKSLANTKTS